MFIFEIAASVVCILLCMAIFNKIFGTERTIRGVLIGMIIFGVFSFFLTRLINGDNATRKRLNA